METFKNQLRPEFREGFVLFVRDLSRDERIIDSLTRQREQAARSNPLIPINPAYKHFLANGYTDVAWKELCRAERQVTERLNHKQLSDSEYYLVIVSLATIGLPS